MRFVDFRPVNTVALVVVATAGLLLLGCGATGSGRIVTESYDVGPFAEIEVDDGFDVEVTTGGTTSVEIDIDDNLVNLLDIHLDGDRLFIGFANNSSVRSASPVARVSIGQIATLIANDGSDVVVNDVDGDHIELTVSDGASITAHGQIATATLTADDGADLHLEGLSIEAAEIVVSDGADLIVTQALSVSGSVSDGADVTVSGDATTDIEVSDGADVHRD